MNPRDELRRLGIPADMIDTATVNGQPIGQPQYGRVCVDVCEHGVVRIVIPGPAIGKPRMTQRDKWKKRPCVMRYRDWCDRVRAGVGNTLPAVEDVAELNWTAYFQPPKSWSKTRRLEAMGQRHRSKPDRDNIDKAILDCLFVRDEYIADGRTRKRWDWRARLEVEIVSERKETR